MAKQNRNENRVVAKIEEYLRFLENYNLEAKADKLAIEFFSALRSSDELAVDAVLKGIEGQKKVSSATYDRAQALTGGAFYRDEELKYEADGIAIIKHLSR